MEHLAWPVVVLIVALCALFLFKPQIASLIDRTKEVGKNGLKTHDSQPMPHTEERKGVDEFFRGFESPVLLEAEELIRNDLKSRQIEAGPDREKALIRTLAWNNITFHFERVASSLWASQLKCLRFLNFRPAGANVSDITPLYEDAKTVYPTWYENYSFDMWLGFLQSYNLVNKKESNVFITGMGHEFLKYLVASGKAEPYHG